MHKKAICLALVVLTIGVAEGFKLFSSEDMTASKARDYRAAARYHFTKANEAQRNMDKAQEENDVDAYEKWLDTMRQEDKKMLEAIDNYDEVRDYLESKIWQGELEIKGFALRYEKGTVASLIDHMTGRAKL